MENVIVFGYACTPSCGFFGKSDGGFSVDITNSGELIYKTYIFDHNEVSRKSYVFPKDAIDKIGQILLTKQEVISTIDSRLDNGSCDGACNRFVIDGKEIISWNISRTDVKELKKRNPSYYQEFKKNVMQENSVLDLFDSVTPILKECGFSLSLHEFSVII